MLLAQFEEGFTVLHIATQENHVDVIQKLCGWADECQLNPTELKKRLLLSRNKKRETACQKAAGIGNVEALQILWFLAKETELNLGDMLLEQGDSGFTLLHFASLQNNVDLLQSVGLCRRMSTEPKETKKKLLLSKNQEVMTTWHIAAVKETWRHLKPYGLWLINQNYTQMICFCCNLWKVLLSTILQHRKTL